MFGETIPPPPASRQRARSPLGLLWTIYDVVAAMTAGLVALGLRWNVGWLQLPQYVASHIATDHWAPIGYLILFPIYVAVTGRVLGTYTAVEHKSFINEQRMMIQTLIVAALLLCGSLFLVRSLDLSREITALTVVMTAALTLAARATWRLLRERRYLRGIESRNVMIVGHGKVGTALRNHMLALPHLGFRFAGFIAMDDANANDPETVGTIENCVKLARAQFVDEIYFSTPVEKTIIWRVMEEARVYGIEVRLVPDLYDGLAWNASIEYVGQFPTILIYHGGFPHAAFVIKRVIDIAVSLSALVILSPVLLAIGVAVRLDSRGPILYRSQRVGRKGRVFTCLKFRTMVNKADQLLDSLSHLNERESILFKITRDPRVTRTGSWLRKYSLDELPQLFNVLLGEMSLVGPRPPLSSEVEKYELEHLKRLDAVPGITGLWQVEAREDPSFDSYISLDNAYVDHWNLLMDLRIIARTLGVVLRGTGS